DTACQRQALLCLRNGLLRHQHRVVTVCECVVRARHPLLMTSLLRQVQRLAPASQSLIEISKTESDGAGDESSITLRCQRANLSRQLGRLTNVFLALLRSAQCTVAGL